MGECLRAECPFFSGKCSTTGDYFEEGVGTSFRSGLSTADFVAGQCEQEGGCDPELVQRVLDKAKAYREKQNA